jgi:hypothetical protein
LLLSCANGCGDNHIISKGWIPSTSPLGAIDYGVELVSTNTMNATFHVNNFSLDDQLSSLI